MSRVHVFFFHISQIPQHYFLYLGETTFYTEQSAYLHLQNRRTAFDYDYWDEQCRGEANYLDLPLQKDDNIKLTKNTKINSTKLKKQQTFMESHGS